MGADINKLIENNHYLTDNGYTPSSSGLMQLIPDLIDIIGIDANAHTSGYLYNSSLEAIEAAYIGEPPFAGKGIRGRRTRNIASEKKDLENLYRFISSTTTPESPNFFGDTSDSHGYEPNLKTDFLDKLDVVAGKLDVYLTTLKAIKSALEKIKKTNGEGSSASENNKFPNFCATDIHDDRNSIQPLIVILEENNTAITNLKNFFVTATGVETDFDNKLNSLYNTLFLINNELVARGTGYFETVMVGLKKWRLFWVKERILKHSGSLVKLKAMQQARESAIAEKIAREETLSVISDNKNEWIKAPVIHATYYNPIMIEEVDGSFTEAKRISVILSSFEHTTSYIVIRRSLTDIEGDVTSKNLDNQWSDGSYTTLTGAPIDGIYNDEASFTTDNIYLYRAQAVDSNTDSYTTKSLQSELLGEKISGITKAAAKEINSTQDISGFIFVDGKVNYIEESVENSDGSFLLKLKYSLTSETVEELNLIRCAAPNYFIT